MYRNLQFGHSTGKVLSIPCSSGWGNLIEDWKIHFQDGLLTELAGWYCLVAGISDGAEGLELWFQSMKFGLFWSMVALFQRKLSQERKIGGNCIGFNDLTLEVYSNFYQNLTGLIPKVDPDSRGKDIFCLLTLWSGKFLKHHMKLKILLWQVW